VSRNHHEARRNESKTSRREEEPAAKKEEGFSREAPEENPGKKKEFQTGSFKPISFRR
jgi:hypothetical protein